MSNQRRFALIGRGFGSDAFDEAVTDLIGGILVDSSEINFTYTDATPSITAALIDASIVFARLQNFDALSVLGRAANSSGVSDEITASANDRLLRRTSDTLNFGQLTVGMAPDAVWTFAKLQDADAVSVLGRAANSAGVLDEIAASANDHLLRRTSDTLNFGQLTAGMFPNTVVPDAALSSNVALLDRDPQTFTGVNTFRGVTYFNPDPQTVPAAAINADTRLAIVDNESTSMTFLGIADTSHSLGIRHISAGGTAASPTAVTTTNSSYIGFIGGGGHDGTNWQTGSAGLVGIRPVDTWSGTQRPTRVTIETTPLASTTRAAVASFDQAEIDLTATTLDFNGNADISGTLTVNNDTQLNDSLTISTTQQIMAFVETDASANNGRWDFILSTEQLRFRIIDDAVTLAANWLTVDRTGQTIDEIELNATTLDLNGALDLSGAATLGGAVTFSNTAISVPSGTTITTGGGTLTINGTGETLATFVDDGAVTLYHNNTSRLATSSTGVDIVAGLLLTVASAAGSAGLRLPHGAAPTSPTDGDMWTTTAGLFVRINGSTVGPLS